MYRPFSVETLQEILAELKLYEGEIDGRVGPQTLAAASMVFRTAGIDESFISKKWDVSRRRIAAAQAGLNQLGFGAGTVDGLLGPNTYAALEEFNEKRLTGVQPNWRDSINTPVLGTKWPLEANMPKYYGEPGENHVRLSLPYRMRLAWDYDTTITGFTINEKCAESAHRVLEEVKHVYSESQRAKLGLDLFGGCFNNRNKRGGSSKSTHAYAAAIDFDPARNQLRWGRDRARLAQEDCIEFWKIWEAEGWVSLGRRNNFDWMHVQAAR